MLIYKAQGDAKLARTVVWFCIWDTTDTDAYVQLL